jgi:cell wall-associated NlpC family hydrolase
MGRRQLAIAAVALLLPVTAPAHAATKTTPRRLIAYEWAVAQRGKPYQWGSTGPGSYDCSGLAYEAYLHEGVNIGRDTYAMLASPRLVRIPASQARRGDLAFFGAGHVEIFARPGWTFGALDQGTVVWWHRYGGWWHPSGFYRLRLCTLPEGVQGAPAQPPVHARPLL